MIPVVRPAELRDLPGIVALYRTIEGTTWEYTEVPHTLEERSAWFAEQTANGWPVLVCEEAGEIVGVASYGPFRDNARWPGYRFTAEHTIHVDQRYQRRGIGRALMAELLSFAHEAGLRVLVAGIDSSNLVSIAFHARLGFTETARMPGVGEKWGQRLDLVLMQREVEEPLP